MNANFPSKTRNHCKRTISISAIHKAVGLLYNGVNPEMLPATPIDQNKSGTFRQYKRCLVHKPLILLKTLVKRSKVEQEKRLLRQVSENFPPLQFLFLNTYVSLPGLIFCQTSHMELHKSIEVVDKTQRDYLIVSLEFTTTPVPSAVFLVNLPKVQLV